MRESQGVKPLTMKQFLKIPLRCRVSARLMPHATALIKISPSPAIGLAVSTIEKFSGPPNSDKPTAFIMVYVCTYVSCVIFNVTCELFYYSSYFMDQLMVCLFYIVFFLFCLDEQCYKESKCTNTAYIGNTKSILAGKQGCRASGTCSFLEEGCVSLWCLFAAAQDDPSLGNLQLVYSEFVQNLLI